MENKKKTLDKKTLLQRMSAMRLIMFGYIGIILLGALMLFLPFASKTPGCTPFTDCLFTATSATCVTGLIRYDTFTHWTLFGQLVILFMIQTGGIGFMTVVLMVMKATGSRIGISERTLMQDSISAPEFGGIVKMTEFIVKGTFLIEGTGAMFLAFDYVPRYGAKGVYMAIFHSISAFCNGGFDLMGGITGECSSMIGFETNLYVNLVLSALIILGGLGFYVWKDLIDKEFSWRKLSLQSKLVLSVSGALVVAGTIILFITEYAGPMYEGYSAGDKLLSCFFQSVSARTAGFNSADLSKMTESGLMVMIVLMLIGGSSGSTAGGMKTTTFWVLLASIGTTLKRRKNIEVFGRRIDEDAPRLAACIFSSYLIGIITSAVVIASIEKLPFMTVLFETTSALATVGITLGITGSLGMVSKLIITFLMFCGRLGSITALLAFSPDRTKISSSYPKENINIG
ncbi:MAG: Trk family potassium uptake protein [Lachnospiraceae bacterium]|nr:Trk family potassium uptake protein [Lachnospiraceae bacterium]